MQYLDGIRLLLRKLTRHFRGNDALLITRRQQTGAIFVLVFSYALASCLGIFLPFNVTRIFAASYAWNTQAGWNSWTQHTTSTTIKPGSLTLAMAPTGVSFSSQPFMPAITPDNKIVYVTLPSANEVEVISTETNTVTTTIAVGSEPGPLAVSPDGSKVYVSNQNDGTISVIATATNTVTATIAVGSSPENIAFTPDGSRALVPSSGNVLNIINTATNSIITSITLQKSGDATSALFDVKVMPDGSRAYVDGEDVARVWSINLSTYTPTLLSQQAGLYNPPSCGSCTATPQNPRYMIMSPDGSQIYFSMLQYASPYILDTSADTITQAPTTGTYGHLLNGAFSSDGSTMYVTDGDYSSVNQLNPSTYAVTRSPSSPGDNGGFMAYGTISNLIYFTDIDALYVYNPSTNTFFGTGAGDTSPEYAPSGTATYAFTPQAGTNQTWSSASIAATTPAQTSVAVRYSTDGTSFSPNIASLGPSQTLYLQTTLTTSNEAVTPSLDSLAVTYSAASASLSVSLTSPTGGQSYLLGAGTGAVSSIPITWTTAGTGSVDHQQLQYSLNGGTTWNDIAQGIATATSSYSWVPPITTDSTQAQVRVIEEDSSNADLADSTSGTFTIFTDHPPAVSGLSPVSATNGSRGNNNQPTLNFITSDPDSGDTTSYELQLSTSSNFAAPIIDHTSGQLAPGAASLTPSVPLADGSYYWRVQATDSHGAVSGWAAANAGSVAFIIDTVAPTTPTITYPTTDSTVNVAAFSLTASAYTDAGGSPQAAAQWLLSTHPDLSNPLLATGDDTIHLSSYPLSGLANGQYYAEVRYKSQSGMYSAWSTIDHFIVDVPPLPPTGLTVSPGSSETTLNLSWNDPTAPDLNTITVYRSNTMGTLGSIVATITAGTQVFHDAGLAPQTYFYTLTATNSLGGISPDSTQVSGAPPIIASTLDLLLPGQRFVSGIGVTGTALLQPAGNPVTVGIYAVDDAQRVATGATNRISLSGTDAVAPYPPSLALHSGQANEPVIFRTPGIQMVTGSANGLTSGSQTLVITSSTPALAATMTTPRPIPITSVKSTPSPKPTALVIPTPVPNQTLDTATPIPSSSQSPPLELSVDYDPTTRQSVLTWAPPVTTVPVAGYVIYRSTDPSVPENSASLLTKTDGTTFRFVDAVLPAPGKALYYKVEAVDATGAELVSATASSTAVQNTLPSRLTAAVSWFLGTILLLTPLAGLIRSSLVTGELPLQSFFLFISKRYRSRQRWGVIRDPANGFGVPGAQLGLVPVELGLPITRTIADLSGGFDFLVNRAGVYQLAAAAQGYASTTDESRLYNSEPPQPALLVSLRRSGDTTPYRHLVAGQRFSGLARMLERVSVIVFVVGVALAIYDVITLPNLADKLILALYVILTLIELREFLCGHVQGLVLTSDGHPVAGAIVRAYGETGGYVVASAVTNDKGVFELNLPGGEYAIGTELTGFEDGRAVPVHLRRGKRLPVSVVINPITYTA